MADAAPFMAHPVRRRLIADAVDLVMVLVIASLLFSGCAFITRISYEAPEAANLPDSQRATLRWRAARVEIDGVLMRDEVEVGWFSTSGTVTTAAKIAPGEHEVRWERTVKTAMGFRYIGGRITFVAEPGHTYELKSRRPFFTSKHCEWIEEAETRRVAGGEPRC